MDWTQVVTALISLAGAALGTMYGIHKANNLTVYRLEQLEEKMDKHNGVYDKVFLIEHQINEYKKQMESISTNVARYGEQIDNVYSLAEKQQDRIELIERSIISRVGGQDVGSR